MSPFLYRLLVASGVVFAISLVLALLDGTGVLILPQLFRPAIPIALVLSTLVCIVILSGSIGMPTRPPPPDHLLPNDASGDDAPEAEEPDVGARG